MLALASASPDRRATAVAAAMTLDEKLALVHGLLGSPWEGHGVRYGVPDGAIPSAGFVRGIARLNVPNLYETDASLGIANSDNMRPGDVATALPSTLALAAGFDVGLAVRAGALLGSEARAKGFNVLLGGGMNLARDPRNGRNFEYLGEDPWLAGTLGGAEVRGTQSQHVISTVKHLALNAHETNRSLLDARIDGSALRESDLLAFEIAIERGHPGAVMCAYNRVNGAYSCGNYWLLQEVLKRDWRYPGWVMSDWGAVHATLDAVAGLDQESGEQLDDAVYFDAPLKAALLAGTVPTARLEDMVHRILRSMFAVGIASRPQREPIDYAAHGRVALEIARRGSVLLKNDGVLPLASAPAPASAVAGAAAGRRIVVIGGHADVGVLSGGGSSQVVPVGGVALRVGDAVYDPSPPLAAIRAAAAPEVVSFDAGTDLAAAAAAAAAADVAIVFVVRHEREGSDLADLRLPSPQDDLVSAVAAANPRTIVVLETGNPVEMPWLGHVGAVLEAWYPGQRGGEAIADLLFGRTNPSGRLPLTFPRSAADGVRPLLPNGQAAPATPVHVDYSEGAEVGYRWYAAHRVTPLFAFGHGLSYTRFSHDDIKVSGGRTLTVSFEVRNTGTRSGADVPQLYLTSAPGGPTLRLLGFERVELAPGARRRVVLSADPRLLGRFEAAEVEWRLDAGAYRVAVGESAENLELAGGAVLTGRIVSTRGVNP